MAAAKLLTQRKLRSLTIQRKARALTKPGRPLTQAEWDSAVYPDGQWELHMEFDERAVKEDSFTQLKQMVYYCQHDHDSVDQSCIEICTPRRNWGDKFAGSAHHEFSSSVQIKRVEVFEADATVLDVLQRIAAGMCCGFYEGIEAATGERARSPEGRAVFELGWGT